MAAAVDYKPQTKGVAELLKLPGVQADLMARGERVRAAAGPSHEVVSRLGRTRARVQVRTTTHRAAARERRTHNLVRALDAAR
jgi:hypothetical protein